jgi:hypothetical protein
VDKRIPAIMEQDTCNVPELAGRVVELQPKLLGKEREFHEFCRLLSKLVKVTDSAGRHRAFDEARETIQGMSNGTATKAEVALKFACSAVVDVVAQGWQLAAGKKTVTLHSPKQEGASPDEVKQRIREGHLLERDAQLREPSVRDFIKGMEQRRLGPKGWVSVFSLMRDGRELRRKLQDTLTEQPQEQRLESLRSCIAPYLQVVESDAICEFTGLRLTDIWRYFRHTWVSTYKSLPGRSMMILVRDAAAPCHPVIGIAALGSSMAQQTQRDRWIGWDADKFLEQLTAKPTARMCRWVHESVERLIGSIHIADLLADGIIERRELKSPTERVISRLLRDAERAASFHRLDPDAANHKSNTNAQAEVNWEKQARTPLFRSKRSKTLALLLGIRAGLKAAGLDSNSSASLKAALANPQGHNAVRQLVRLVKAEHVGVDMMDIIICGAVAPYNVLLGGKLVCLLLTSPEVVAFYRERYGEQASIIASSMKGAPVVRPPNLVLLATTSLYGVGSSQYNRLRLPLEEVGGKTGHRLEYVELGASKGYGSYHFSQASVDYLETLLGRAGDGRKVNSIFGEGVNPLMRKLRDGLAEVGLPSDDLLKHGNTRVVYGVPLAENFREVLLGLDTKPSYLLPMKQPESSTEALAEYWRRRWLAGRITRDGILEDVQRHTLSYPIAHGARVALPVSGEVELFG